MKKMLIFAALIAILGTAIAGTTFNTERGKSTQAPGWYGLFLKDTERTPEQLEEYRQSGGSKVRYRRFGNANQNPN